MAHYMPWYECNPARKQWGWHWTMNHYQPDRIVPNPTGRLVSPTRREAASHFYPLIGLYDSNDPDALECHVLLMKLSGIDGVIIDWYGPDALYDYALLDRNTQHLIKFIKKAGLRFCLMYEDQSVPNLIQAKRLVEADVVAHGQRVLAAVQKRWFTDPAHLTTDNRPVFMVFGSGYYKEEQWKQIFAPLPKQPYFFTESYRRPPAVGGFSWPQPGGGTKDALKEIAGFYQQAKTWDDFVPAAFPRFKDIYVEAGVHKSWGTIEDNDGKTYRQTLEQALKSKADIIQLATWNDWGEGTMIEPSVEFGYRDLEATQKLRRLHKDPRFPYTAQDLRLPVTLYNLRKQGNPKQKPALDEVSRLLFAGQVKKARAFLTARFPSL